MESSALIFAGTGSQAGGRHKTATSAGATTAALVIDPPDDYTFWYVNQYIPTNGSFNFHTRLASLRFPAWHRTARRLSPTEIGLPIVPDGSLALPGALQ